MNREVITMTGKNETESRLGIALLNGAVLSLIGILVLVTPWVTELTDSERRLDNIAGSALLIVGLGLLYWHFKRTKA